MYDYSSEEDNERRQPRSRPTHRDNSYTNEHRNQNRLYEGERNREAGGSRIQPQEKRKRDIPHIQVTADPPKEKQYRDILMSAHSRPGSRTNLYRNSNQNLSRKSSYANTHRPTNDAKDEEIRRLQAQLKEATSSKNETRSPPPPPPNETTRNKKTEEAMNFITQTMKALEAFKEQLTK